MSRSLKRYWAIAGGLVAAGWAAATFSGAIAQTGNTAAAGGMNFHDVPEVNIVPGAVQVRPDIKNPAAESPGSVERGMQYFVKFNCVGCHAANGAGGMGPALSEGLFKYGREPANVYLTIVHGRPLGMPAWGALLPDQVVWDLVSYVESISNAPASSWGTTVSPAAQMPSIEQVPAEFKQTASPWQFTEPFSSGQQPPGHKPSGAQN